MENKLSFAFDDERSTYTEGESKSRRSSILKPPKARAPLQEVNLGGTADETEEFDTLRKRRVSFAGVNSVKEFCSNAESAHVGHIQSYEETFSTSSDGSHNSTEAKSLQDTPKAATTPSFVDKNFIDDPMDLTDSIIENNVPRKFDPTAAVSIVPLVASETTLRTNSFTSNMSLSATVEVGGNPGPVKENAKSTKDSDVVVTNPISSCSMEMTEPVQKIRPPMDHQQPPSQPRGFPFKSPKNSFKATEAGLSDSGMEFTEAIPGTFGAFQRGEINDNVGDASMEMTEVVRRDGKSTAPSFSFTNRSASLDFTGVVRNEPKFVTVRPQNTDFSKDDNSGSCTGMEITQVKTGFVFGQSVKPYDKENPRALFGDSIIDKSGMLSPCADESLNDMEMTGVLSLSKYHRQISGPEANDMDFTHLLSSTRAPPSKHTRLSVEPDDDPLPFPSRFDELEQQSVAVKVGPAQVGPTEKVGDHLALGEEEKVEEDEDMIALNFNRKSNSPVELSFLKEFRDSPEAPEAQPSRIPEKPRADKKVASNDDHILLFSMSRVVDDVNREFVPVKNDFPLKDSIQTTAHTGPLNKLGGPRQSSHAANTSDLGGTHSFQGRLGTDGDIEGRMEPLREMRKSHSEDPVPLRVSFKDFEIKGDSDGINESMPAVGMDDSNILKAVFNDFTRSEEQVPGVSSMCINTTEMESTINVLTSIQTKQTGSKQSAPEHQEDKENLLFTSEVVNEGHDMMANCKTIEMSMANPVYEISMPIVFNRPPEKPTSGQSFGILEVPESPGVPVDHLETRTENTTEPEVRRPRKSIFPVSMFYSSPSISRSQQMELTEVRAIKQPEAAQSLAPVNHSILDNEDMELSLMDQTLMTKVEAVRSASAPCNKKSLCSNETLPKSELADEDHMVPGTKKFSFAMEDTRMAEHSGNAQIFRRESHAVTFTNEETRCLVETSPNYPLMDVQKSSGVSPLAIDTEETLAKFAIASMCRPDQAVDSEMEPTYTATVPLNFKPVPTRAQRPSCADTTLVQSMPVLEVEESPDRSDGLGKSVGQKTFAESIGLDRHQYENYNATPSSKTSCLNEVKELDLGPLNAVDSQCTVGGYLVNADASKQMPVRISSLGPANSEESFLGSELNDPPERAEGYRKSVGQKTFAEVIGLGGHPDEKLPPVPARKSSCVSEMAELDQVSQNAEDPNTFSGNLASVRAREDHVPRMSLGFFNAKESEQKSLSRRKTFAGSLGTDEHVDNNPSLIQPRKSSFYPEPVEYHVNSRKSLVSHKSFGGNSSIDETETVGLKSPFRESPVDTEIRENIELSNTEFSDLRKMGVDDVNDQDDVGCPSLAVKMNVSPHDGGMSPRKVVDCNIDVSLSGNDPVHVTLHESGADAETDQLPETLVERQDPLPCHLGRKSCIGVTNMEGDFLEPLSHKPTNIEESTSFEIGRKEEELNRLSDIGEVPQIGGKEQLSRKSVKFPPSPEKSTEELEKPRSPDVPPQHSGDEDGGAPKMRLSRKSCIGLEVVEVAVEGLRRVSLDDLTEDFEFAIHRNKRKSTIGVRDGNNPLPEGNDHLLEHADTPQPEVALETGQTPAADAPEDDPCANLPQEVMNISLNFDSDENAEDELTYNTSTPCKPVPTRIDKRKRIPTSTYEIDRNLSQEMMNISIESDTRSPMPKKPWSSRSTPAHEKPLSPGVSLVNRRPSLLSTTKNKVMSHEAVQGDLPYEVRLKNCNFMKSRDFRLLVANTYQMLFFQTALGLKVVFPPCELSEDTEILDVCYTFYPHKIGRTCHLHREVVDFFKRRLYRNQPEEWIKGECRTVRDLDRIISCLKQEVSSSAPLIKRLTYVKMTENCEIIDDRIHFRIINTDLKVKFDVSASLPTSHTMSDVGVVVSNATRKIDEDTVRMIYRTLPLCLEMYSMFVEVLTENTPKLLVR